MLQEPAEPLVPAEPKQSGSFRYLQGMLEAGEGGKTPAPSPHLPPHSWYSGIDPLLRHPWHGPCPALPKPHPQPVCRGPESRAQGPSPTSHRSEVFPFFSFFSFLPPPLRTWLLPPALGFQGSGRDLAAPGT